MILGCFAITFIGWWVWNLFLSGVYARDPSPYGAHGGFTTAFGRDPLWWLTLIVAVATLISIEMVYKTIKRNMIVARLWRWPPWHGRAHGDNAEEWDLELWQEMEQDPVVKQKLMKILEDESKGQNGDDDDQDDEDAMAGLGIDVERRMS